MGMADGLTAYRPRDQVLVHQTQEIPSHHHDWNYRSTSSFPILEARARSRGDRYGRHRYDGRRLGIRRFDLRM